MRLRSRARVLWSAAAWGSACWWAYSGKDSACDSRHHAGSSPWAHAGPVEDRLVPAVADARRRRQGHERAFDGYIDADELASRLLDPKQRHKLAVVDVRDRDYRTSRVGRCKIVGARHVPARALRQGGGAAGAEMGALVAALRDNYSTVVFHCMYSQQRGPACAHAYAQARRHGAGPPPPRQQVLVLEDGFAGFYKRHYGRHPQSEALFERVESRASAAAE